MKTLSAAFAYPHAPVIGTLCETTAMDGQLNGVTLSRYDVDEMREGGLIVKPSTGNSYSVELKKWKAAKVRGEDYDFCSELYGIPVDVLKELELELRSGNLSALHSMLVPYCVV